MLIKRIGEKKPLFILKESSGIIPRWLFISLLAQREAAFRCLVTYWYIENETSYKAVTDSH